MEIRAYAAGIVEATTLDGKLAAPPEGLTDVEPGYPIRYAEPMRPDGLEIVLGGAVKVPPAESMHDPAQRVRILHALANHELQAVELFAWALLAFPETPPAFRRGCLAILAEEQAHCGLYLERLEAHGAAFGDLPVNGHFWNKIGDIHTPLQFVCTFGLTFENANLDFAQEHIDAAATAGDDETAGVLQHVHRDEVRHVAFAWHWLREFKAPGDDDWETYLRSVAAPHGPWRARGARFDRDAREAAGLDPDFIDRLQATPPTAPGGSRR